MSPKEDDRRQQILDAALDLFARKGFKGASIKELAKAAGVSPGLIYWYFQDKEGLFAALLEHQIADAFEHVDEHVTRDMPPAQFLPAFGHFYVDQLEQPGNTALFKMMLANVQATPAMMRRVQTQLVGRVLGLLDDYLQRQVVAGRIRPCNTEIVTRTFMGGIFGYLMLKHILGDPDTISLSPDALIDGVSAVVLRGILRDPSVTPGPEQTGEAR
jgi:TetR/AcrR family transcriptional repressor of mexJK operon